jgi:hypothetical protein
VHRLSAFVQVAVADDFTQRADDVGFGFEVHGQVRMRPVAQHAQTDKVFTLTVNLGGGVFAALARNSAVNFSPACRIPAPLSARSADRGSPSPERKASHSPSVLWT